MPTAKVCDFPKYEICSVDTLIYYSLLIPGQIGKKIVLYESIHYLKFNIIGKLDLHSYLTRFSKSPLELVGNFCPDSLRGPFICNVEIMYLFFTFVQISRDFLRLNSYTLRLPLFLFRKDT